MMQAQAENYRRPSFSKPTWAFDGRTSARERRAARLTRPCTWQCLASLGGRHCSLAVRCFSVVNVPRCISCGVQHRGTQRYEKRKQDVA